MSYAYVDPTIATLVAAVAAATPGATLTDSTGGTAATTLAAITAGSSYAQADMVAVKNALSQLVLNENATATALAALQALVAKMVCSLKE